jgi:hypothetical protein
MQGIEYVRMCGIDGAESGRVRDAAIDAVVRATRN